MISLLRENILFTLIFQADVLTWIVVGSLLFVSILCWWFFLYKYVSLLKKRSELRYIRSRLMTIGSLDELIQFGSMMDKTAGGRFIVTVITNVRRQLRVKEGEELNIQVVRTCVANAADAALSDKLRRETRLCTFIKMSAETAPLIGLFGTIWGIIRMVNTISEPSTSKSLVMLLPEALITALIGLFVAIPSIIQYTLLMRCMSGFEHELTSVADQLEWIVNKSVLSIEHTQHKPFDSMHQASDVSQSDISRSDSSTL